MLEDFLEYLHVKSLQEKRLKQEIKLHELEFKPLDQDIIDNIKLKINHYGRKYL